MAAPAALGAKRRRHAISGGGDRGGSGGGSGGGDGGGDGGGIGGDSGGGSGGGDGGSIGGGSSGRSSDRRVLPRGGGSAHPAHASSLQAHAFPEDARALVLRRHALRMSSSDDVAGMWLVIRRFCMLALALGRRAVLPLVPCVLSPCAPRVPNPLRSSPLHHLPRRPGGVQRGQPGRLTIGLDAASGRLSAGLARVAGHVQVVGHGDCAPPPPWLLPAHPALLPVHRPGGARRPLGTEPLISTADLVRLLEEAGSVAGEHNKVVATTSLGANWTEDSLDAMRKHAAARVLVLDAGGQPMARLPSIQWLISQVSGTAAEEAIGHHAARCFMALGRG